MAESLTPKNLSLAAGDSPETAKTRSFNNGACNSGGGLSEGCRSYPAFTDKVWGDLLRKGSEESSEDIHEVDASFMGDDCKKSNAITSKTRFGPRTELSSVPTSFPGSALAIATSAGSPTPRSPLATSRTSHIDVLLSDRNGCNEVDDAIQVYNLHTVLFYRFRL